MHSRFNNHISKVKKSPQDQWISLIEDAARQAATKEGSVPSNIKQHLIKIAELGNVPRNKNKFTNFVKNSLRLHSAPIIDDIWGFLESLKKKDDLDETVQKNSSDNKLTAEVKSGQHDDESKVCHVFIGILQTQLDIKV